jgi:hypothetical protein
MLNLTLTFDNETNIKLRSRGRFYMFRPEVTDFSHDPLFVDLDTSGSPLIRLGLGDPVGVGSMSWRWSVKLSPKFTGTISYVQLIKRDMAWNAGWAGIPLWSKTWGEFWLDNADPYPAATPVITSEFTNPPLQVPTLFGDGPSLSADLFSYVDAADEFRTYLRFESSAPNSIPVTIGRVTWGWKGKATKSNGVWTLFDDSISGPNAAESHEFPIWTDVYHNFGGSN